MKPGLEDTQVFLAVVESRSFTLAAERLSRTKSAVSQAVTRLETGLGARLLHRSTRSLSLTEAGREFYSHCCDIRDSYDKALASIEYFGAKASGQLTITAPHVLSDHVIVPAISQLLDENPAISIRLLSDDKPVDLVEAQIDLAIRVGTLDLQTAKVSRLGMLNESLYVSPDYAQLMGGIPENMQALEHWQHIANDWQGQPVKYACSNGLSLRAKPRIRCNTLNNVVALVLQGQGVARLPDIAAGDYLEQGRMVKLEQVASSPVHTMHLFSNRPPDKVKRFVKILKSQLQAKKGWKK